MADDEKSRAIIEAALSQVRLVASHLPCNGAKVEVWERYVLENERNLALIREMIERGKIEVDHARTRCAMEGNHVDGCPENH